MGTRTQGFGPRDDASSRTGPRQPEPKGPNARRGGAPKGNDEPDRQTQVSTKRARDPGMVGHYADFELGATKPGLMGEYHSASARYVRARDGQEAEKQAEAAEKKKERAAKTARAKKFVQRLAGAAAGFAMPDGPTGEPLGAATERVLNEAEAIHENAMAEKGVDYGK